MVHSPYQVMVHVDDEIKPQAQKRRRCTSEYNGNGNSQDGIENENYRGINISNQQQQQQQSREEVNKNGGEAINEVGIDNKNNLVVPNQLPLAGYATNNAPSPALVGARNEEQNLHNVPPSVLFDSLLADEEKLISTPSSITLHDVPADELFDSLIAEADLSTEEEKQNATPRDNISGSRYKEVELINRLNLEGCPLIAETTDTIDESELAKKYIDKCQFKKIRSYNDNTVVETAELEFRDPLLMMKTRQEMRQMKISVTRSQKFGESVWNYHYEFYMYSNRMTLFCVQHNQRRSNCSICNKCTHLDPKEERGYSKPNVRCIKCCPRITCTNCGMEPRLVYQSSRDPMFGNHCARCYRLATGNARIEDICIEFIRNANIPISSANKEVMGLSYRPDAEITTSPLNDISYECDDEKGHIYYLVDDQHKRTVELNEQRLDEKGKVTIRQHPVHIWDSPQQTEQNQVMVNLIKEYFDRDLGQRSDGQGGLRVIVFIGHSRTNPHYKRAIEEMAKGYWDIVRLINPITPNRKWFENDMSSV